MTVSWLTQLSYSLAPTSLSKRGELSQAKPWNWLSLWLDTIFGGLCLCSLTDGPSFLLASILCLTVTALTSCALSPLLPYMSHCCCCVRHFIIIGAVASYVLLASPCMLYCALVSSSLSPPSPHALHHYCPMHLVPITSCVLSPLPCAPYCYHSACHITVALCPLLLTSCSPHPIALHHLWPMHLPSNTHASTCGILDQVKP